MNLKKFHIPDWVVKKSILPYATYIIFCFSIISTSGRRKAEPGVIALDLILNNYLQALKH